MQANAAYENLIQMYNFLYLYCTSTLIQLPIKELICLFFGFVLSSGQVDYVSFRMNKSNTTFRKVKFIMK